MKEKISLALITFSSVVVLTSIVNILGLNTALDTLSARFVKSVPQGLRLVPTANAQTKGGASQQPAASANSKGVDADLQSPSIAPTNQSSKATDILTAQWAELLSQHVSEAGGVSYMGFAKDQERLRAFLDSHRDHDPSSLGDDQRTALYINLYNATMIANLLKAAKANDIPVGSQKFLDTRVNKISVPGGNIWNGDYKVALNGQMLSLDDIEHGLIRGKGPGHLKSMKVGKLDPRIHAAVNCAAISCPKLRNVPYTGTNLEKLLEENMTRYMSHPEQFKKLDDDTLEANSIVFWYYDDFDQHGKAIKLRGAGDYLASFIDPKAPASAWKIDHLKKNFNDRSQWVLKLSSAFDFEYDWRVNDERNL